MKAIVAVALNGVIGNNLDIPWHIPEDFKHFKETTLGSIIVMGSKTWDSLPKKPLPNRTNVVISSKKIDSHDVLSFTSIESMLDYFKDDNRQIWICGGATLYNNTLNLCDEIILSRVKLSPEGNIFFPDISKMFEFNKVLAQYEKFDVVSYLPIEKK